MALGRAVLCRTANSPVVQLINIYELTQISIIRLINIIVK